MEGTGFKCDVWTSALAERALSPGTRVPSPVLDGTQDRVGDREPAVRPVKLARLVEAARERGIRVAVKLLGDVGPRVQSGVEDSGRDTRAIPPRSFSQRSIRKKQVGPEPGAVTIARARMKRADRMYAVCKRLFPARRQAGFPPPLSGDTHLPRRRRRGEPPAPFAFQEPGRSNDSATHRFHRGPAAGRAGDGLQRGSPTVRFGLYFEILRGSCRPWFVSERVGR